MLVTMQIESSRRWSTFQRSLRPVDQGAEWHVRGSYFESCNCDAICPCRRIGGVAGGRSTHGICLGALSWLIDDGRAGDRSARRARRRARPSLLRRRARLAVERLPVRRRPRRPRAANALEEIFLGRRGGDIREHAPWIWKEPARARRGRGGDRDRPHAAPPVVPGARPRRGARRGRRCRRASRR